MAHKYEITFHKRKREIHQEKNEAELSSSPWPRRRQVMSGSARVLRSPSPAPGSSLSPWATLHDQACNDNAMES